MARGQRIRRIFWVSLGIATFGSVTTTAQVVDDFDTPFLISSAGATNGYPVAGPTILGGDLDFLVENFTLPTPVIVGGDQAPFLSELSHVQLPGGLGRTTLVWDGPDNDIFNVDDSGLGSADLTLNARADALEVVVTFLDRPLQIPVRVYDPSGMSEVILNAPATAASTTYLIPFVDFVPVMGGNIDFDGVGAIAIEIDGASEPGLVARLGRVGNVPLIRTTKSDTLVVDRNNDGLANPGDRLRYTVVIENPTDAWAATETGLRYESQVDPSTTLVNGTVTTTQGSVGLGNGAGDKEIFVTLGDLSDGGSLTITYDVDIHFPVAAGTDEISCQGGLSSDTLQDLPTDDPDVGGEEDATTTPIVASAAISAIQVDAHIVDVDGDSGVDPGDTLRYTIQVLNTGDSGAANVTLATPAGVHTSLVAGSVVTSQGTVASGNVVGDTTVAVVGGEVDGAAGQLVVMFDAVVHQPLPVGIDLVSSQSTVSFDGGGSVLTDDPDAFGSDNPTTTGVQVPAVSLSKSVRILTDADFSSGASRGDTLRYTLTVDNGSFAAAAHAVVVRDTPDLHSELVNGSVSTTQGTVLFGNNAGDAVVAVDVGTVLSPAAATVTFDVVVLPHPTDGPRELRNQALLLATNVAPLSSDDPSEPGTDDPTVIPLEVGPPDIPTLGEWSLVLFAFALAILAATRLERLRSRRNLSR